jgi:hypothetical protein
VRVDFFVVESDGGLGGAWSDHLADKSPVRLSF